MIKKGGQIYEELDDRALINSIKDNYNLDILQIFKLSQLTDNDIYLLKTIDENFILKSFNKEIGKDFIYYENMINKINKHYLLPNIINNISFTYYGKINVLLNFLDGDSFNYGDIDKIKIASKGLAHFHKNNFLYKQKFINYKSDLVLYNQGVDVFHKLLENGYEEIGKLYINTYRRINKNKKMYQKSILHGSFDTGHIFFNKNKINMFDLETIGYGDIVFELGYSAYNFSFNKVKHDYISISDSIIFIKEYCKIIKLNNFEFEILSDIILLSFIIDFYIMIKEQKREGTKGSSSAKINTQLRYLLYFYNNMEKFSFELNK